MPRPTSKTKNALPLPKDSNIVWPTFNKNNFVMSDIQKVISYVLVYFKKIVYKEYNVGPS
jgi:hypothetical protein